MFQASLEIVASVWLRPLLLQWVHAQAMQVAVNSYLNYMVVFVEQQGPSFQFAQAAGVLVLIHFSVTVLVFFLNRAYSEGPVRMACCAVGLVCGAT